ncbi:hypothetical protein T439DRAFT_326716 [Meredithblackwellia eburnea MCA 4105]
MSGSNPSRDRFLARCTEFLAEVEDLTPGKDLEARLNSNYGPGNTFYEDFKKFMTDALNEDSSWIANIEVEGRHYRRSKVCGPCEETRFMSITTVYMESEEPFRGQYHKHPYGEINCVIPLTSTAELMGMQGWQGAGWTSPGPGTHHYPEVRGGAIIALFFLPAGRISYKASPGDPQPLAV